ncbi:S8 family serine peptidase [Streptomyces chartreusis]|uniref:cyanobactin maturation protease PatG family protein n=1 Tax=Streptomyces chartreusis TaxID=1969 RepID=UPI0036782AC7
MDARSVLQGLTRPDELLGSPEVCIAVLDGPVDLSHPCFAGADLTRIDTLVQDPPGRGPMSVHGTHVTSLLFGQPGSTLVGMAPRCRGLILPIFPDASGMKVPQLDLARAIERAVEEGAHVINISGGERAADGSADSTLERALRLCEDYGVLVVAAVGNDGCDCLQVPAALSSVVAVGAAGSDGRPLEVNNWGSAYRTNGVLAPGQDIEGASPGRGRQKLTGSSFATPLVSGVAALLISAQLRQGREADPQAAGQAILQTATVHPCSPGDAPECRRNLAGDLNAKAAYDLVNRGDRAPVIALETAPVPSSPAQQHQAQAWETISGPGVSAAGEPSSLGTPHSEPNEGASAMDTQATATSEPTDAAAEHTGGPESAAPAQQTGTEQAQAGAPGPEPSAGAEASGLETAQSQPNEGARSMTAQPTRVDEGARSSPQAPSAERLIPGSPAADVSPHRSGVRPSCGCGGSSETGCSCGGNGGHRQLIYAIGTIGFDYLTDACRDAFRQQMPAFTVPASKGLPERELPANPYDGEQLSDFLASSPWLSDKVTWLLQHDGTPIYALEPEDAAGLDWSRPVVKKKDKSGKGAQEEEDGDEYDFEVPGGNSLQRQFKYLLETLSHPPVSTIHRTFRDALKGQLRPLLDPGRISRVSIPGELTGRTVRLYSGQVVPLVKVKTPGVHTWNETALVSSVVGAIRQAERDAKKPVEEQEQGQPAVKARIGMSDAELNKLILAFLDKIYYQFRNLGQTSADRALNFAGTNAYMLADTVKDGLLAGSMVPGPGDEGRQHMYALDSIRVSKSPYCRPGSDCQDVIVTFFDPENDQRAKVSYLYTYDVSYHLPVSLAPVHTFLDK